MDVTETTDEFQDWEVLQANSDTESTQLESPDSTKTFDNIDSETLIQTNYFSLDSQNPHVEDLDDHNSAESDSPRRIEPDLDAEPTQYPNEEPDSIKFGDFEGKNEMGHLKFEESPSLYSKNEEIIEKNDANVEKMEKICADSSQIEVGSIRFDAFEEKNDVDIEENIDSRDGSVALGQENAESESVNGNGSEKRGEIEKRSVMWWKMPVQFVKYCMVRLGPAWSVSMAAAAIGLVILSRRLYKMKKKARGLEIKVTVDDKKVSQFMSRAARLNEAFSVVKRVPVIRPALHGTGVQTWPAMNLR